MNLDQPISALRALVHLAPPVVARDDGIARLAAAIASDPAAGVAFVVDEQAHLLGAVTRKDLDVQLLALALPRVAARRMDFADQREVWGWAHGTDATAANLMVGIAVASVDDRVSQAIERAIDDGRDVVPVLDREHRLLGYISVFEVLAAQLEPGP
jgi:CBS-domain-containing membrane protein